MGLERPIGLLIVAHFLVTTAQAKIQYAPRLFSDIPWIALGDMGVDVPLTLLGSSQTIILFKLGVDKKLEMYFLSAGNTRPHSPT